MTSDEESRVPINDSYRARKASAAASESGTEIRLAAVLVLKALDGESHDTACAMGEQVDRKSSIIALKAHLWRHKFRNVRRLSLVGINLLTFLTRPRWCCSPRGPQCHDPHWHTYPVPYLSMGQSLALEGLFFVALTVDLVLWVATLGKEHLARCQSVRLWHVIGAAVMGIDLLIAAVRYPQCGHWRISPYLRFALLFAYNNAWFREAKTFVVGTRELVKLVVILESFVLVSAWFGVLLFANSGPEMELFDNFGDAFWNLQVLLTTNNFPDIMIKGYTASRITGAFFAMFVIVGLFLLLQMVIAVVCEGYINHRKEFITELADQKKRLLDEAFEALDVNKEGWLSKECVFDLLACMSEHGSDVVQDHEVQALIFAVLDKLGNNRLCRQEFSNLTRTLGLHFKRVKPPWLQRHAPGIWQTLQCDKLKEVVQSQAFDTGMLGVTLVYMAIGVRLSWPLLAGSGKRMLDSRFATMADVILALLYFLESATKVALVGWKEYLENWAWCFDGLSTLALLSACVLMLLPNEWCTRQVIQTTMVIGMMRVFRLFSQVPTFKNTFLALKAVSRGVGHLVPGFLIRFFMFDLLALDLFGGLMTTDRSVPSAEPLSKTVFAMNGYHAFNFNDLFSGSMFLFGGLVMNGWNVYTDAVVSVAGPWARVFFVCWWIAGVLSGLNLVTAVALTAVVKEMNELDDQEEHREKEAPQDYATIKADVITGTATGVQGEYRVSVNADADETFFEDPVSTTSARLQLIKDQTRPTAGHLDLPEEDVRELEAEAREVQLETEAVECDATRELEAGKACKTGTC